MGKNQSLTLLMILCYACRQEPSILFYERLHPAAASDVCRNSQSNIGWSLGTLMEGQAEALRH
ncbi:mCG1044361 [Mus musculus]|nr:mCG1044361 [Mus musculus]